MLLPDAHACWLMHYLKQTERSSVKQYTVYEEV